ncbi:MAG: MBL fold metallo-hydrolase [Pseudomonadota bacterium]
MAELKFTILGCGSSGGVPRLGGHWGDCDPQNPRNRRSRCSLLVERVSESGTTRALIDTSPDMRSQLLAAEVGTLDAVVFTHPHADHTHGLDDLRMIVFNMRKRLNVWADSSTQASLMARFGYAFVQPSGSPYPPILDMHTIDGVVEIGGQGGTLRLEPFEVAHGTIDALGFRIGDLAYLPDVSELTDDARALLTDLGVWIVDALRRDPHPTHAHLAQTLEWIDEIAPGQAVLTNMHIDLDYDTIEAETPAHVTPAYDGMVIRRPIV